MTRFPRLHALLTGDQNPAASSPCGRPDTALPDQIVSPPGPQGSMTGDDQEVRRLQQEREALLARQIGRPDNRDRMRTLTTQQLRAQVGASPGH